MGVSLEQGLFTIWESKVLQLTDDKIWNNIIKLHTCVCLMDNYKLVKCWDQVFIFHSELWHRTRSQNSQRSQSFVSWFIYYQLKTSLMCFPFKISSNYNMLMIRGSSGLWQTINIWHVQHWAEFEERESQNRFFFRFLNVWASLCGLIYVQSLTLGCFHIHLSKGKFSLR